MHVYIENKKVKIENKAKILEKITTAIYNNKIKPYTYSSKVKSKLLSLVDKLPMYNIYKDRFEFIELHRLYEYFFTKAYRLKDYHLFDFQELSAKFINSLFYENKELFYDLTDCVHPWFIPYFTHIKPYFTKQELVSYSLNMDIREKNYEKLCQVISKKSILAKDIESHHNLIFKLKMQNLIQNYTFYDSYFFNHCLRKNNIFDEIIYKNILLLKKLISQAPNFTNNVIVYRFIDDDTYLKNVKLGDIYISDSFLSCSRDPKINDFGTIIKKIHISNKISGIGLSIEGYSMYPKEEEIVLPPALMMKLINKKKDYYEFEVIDVAEFKITKPLNTSCPIYDFEDFYFSMDSFEKQINHLYENLCHNNYLFKLKVENELFLFTVIKYDSLNPHYTDFYKLKTTEGIIINYIHNSTYDVIYTFELSKDSIYANYISKYYPSRVPFDEALFSKILAILGKIFRIEEAIIYPIYYPCTFLSEKTSLKHDLFTYNHDLFIFLQEHKKMFESFNTIYNYNYYQCTTSFEAYKKLIFDQPMEVKNFENLLGIENLFYQLNINDILKRIGLKMFTNSSYYVSDRSLSYFGIK
jgi:hypothetical protein